MTISLRLTIQVLLRLLHKQRGFKVTQDGQSGRLGEAMAGLHGLISLHLKAWGYPPHS